MQALAIAFGQGHGFQDTIHGSDAPGRTLAGQGQGNRAAARAKVEYLGRCGRQQFQRGFHQQFGVGARDQRVRCHFQVQLPETLLAEDIGHRLTAAAALQILGERQRRFARHDALRPGMQETAGLAQGRRQQQFGIQTRRRRVG
ncbi:hypothetical protein D9M72_514660 [compost metagenome]